MEIDNSKITTVKNIYRTEEKPSSVDSAAVCKSVESTNLSNMPVSNINVNVPISYKNTGKIKILGDLEAQTYKLFNGQRVIILPKKGPTVVKTYVNVGSMNEPDHLRGISHYIEHNVFNGTKDLKPNEFFSRVRKMGGMTNASTNFAVTDYYITSQLLNEGDLEEKIKLHSDMLQHPVFAPDMLEKERGPVISEISMVMDDPQNLALNRAIKNLYQIKSSSTDLVAGTINNIKNVTRKDVLDYYNKYYTLDNFITVVTGEVDPNTTIDLLAKYFSNPIKTNAEPKKYEELNPIKQSIRMDEESKKAVTSSVVMAFNGPKNDNTKDKVAMDMLAQYLVGSPNSGLRKILEESHVDVGAQLEKIGNNKNDHLAFLLSAQCIPSKVDDTINKTYQCVNDVQQNGISQKDLLNVRQACKIMLSDIEESAEQLNNYIGSAYLDNDFEYLTNYKKYLNNITVEDIKNAARKYIDLNKASIAVVNPPKDDKQLSKSQSVSFGAGNNKIVKKECCDLSNVKTLRLQNNIEIVTLPSVSDSASIALNLYSDVPAAVKPGVSDILSGMLERALNKKVDNAIKEDSTVAQTWSIAATPDGIGVYAKSEQDGAEKTLKLAKEAVFSPELTEENFNFIKAQVIEQVTQSRPSAIDNASVELYSHLPYVANREGLLKSLPDVTLDDVKGLYQYLRYNAKCACVVGAPFEKYPALQDVYTNNLSDVIPPLKQYVPVIFDSYVPLKKDKTVLQATPKNQAHIIKAYKFKTNGNMEDSAKFDLLNIILGGSSSSRLFNDLREKQKLAYAVSSNISNCGNTGVMRLSILTTTDNPEEGTDKFENVEKSLKGFDKNVKQICTELVSDDELEGAKLYLKTRLLSNSEKTLDKVFLLAKNKNKVYGLNYSNELLAAIDNITKEDIKAAANYIFNNHSVTSIVASPNTIEYYKSKKQIK